MKNKRCLRCDVQLHVRSSRQDGLCQARRRTTEKPNPFGYSTKQTELRSAARQRALPRLLDEFNSLPLLNERKSFQLLDAKNSLQLLDEANYLRLLDEENSPRLHDEGNSFSLVDEGNSLWLLDE